MTDRLHWKNFFSVHRPIQCRHWVDRLEHYAHDHDFYEVVVITGGRGRHRSTDGETAIAAGDVILLTPGVWHEYTACAGLSGFDCCFGKEMLYREFSWITDDPALGRLMLRSAGTPFHRRPVIARIDPQRLKRAAILLEAIADPPDAAVGGRAGQPLVQPSRADGQGIIELLGTMLVVLGYYADAVRPALGSLPATVSPAHAALAGRARAIFAEDLTREWTLGELAAELGTSPSYLTRAFRAVVGRAPMAHYVHCRMEQAAMLLLRSQIPVSEIGAQVGIFDANYFARRFRSEFGLSPSAYRTRFASES